MAPLGSARWTLYHATLFCFFNSVWYVVAMYLVPPTIRALPRDNETHMKYRMIAAILATCISMVLFWFVVPTESISTVVALGLSPQNILNKLLSTTVLMAIFYLGPLATFVHFVAISLYHNVSLAGVATPRSSEAPSKLDILIDILSSDAMELISGLSKHRWIAVRNIIVAPVTEELVYRSVLAPALYFALVDGGNNAGSRVPWLVVWISPFWFALAHLHHLIEKLHSGWSVSRALAITLIQVTYTSIFGAIAALLLLRTGSIYTSILSHCICNSVGLPDLSFLQRPGQKTSDSYSVLYGYRYLHLGLHALGLVLFALLILPMTESYAQQAPFWYPHTDNS